MPESDTPFQGFNKFLQNSRTLEELDFDTMDDVSKPKSKMEVRMIHRDGQ
jgi:hypothetical protein